MKFNPKIHYLPPLLTGIVAVPIMFFQNSFLGVMALLMAGVFFFQVRFLVAREASKSDVKIEQPMERARPRVFSSIDELASGIAHEINNPLAIIAQEATWIDTLLRKKFPQRSDKEVEIEDCLDSSLEIRKQVERCNLIITKLLQMARELNIVVQKIDVNEVTKAVYEIATRDKSSPEIDISLDLDPNTPVIFSDGPLLRQVMLNILMNARQAIGENGLIVIKTSLRENSWVDVDIQDNGCGISEENVQKIFRPFFSTKKGQGAGLGLAICRAIIEELGGKITVTSQVGFGTLFTVSLPLSPGKSGSN